VLPGALVRNELVGDLAMPRLAEVQDPWGAEQPFVRPAAPFPYTNSWGMAYALLTPLLMPAWTRIRSRGGRVLLALGMVVSVYPAAQTSNRGMLLALALFAMLLTGRFVLAGNVRMGLGVLGLLGVAGVGALFGGVFEAIAERQEVSHTTSGRSSIYQATFDKVLESPVVGWAMPDMDPSIGIALGTQGYAWTLLYSYGFLGLALFYGLLGRVLLASWRVQDTAAFVLQSMVATVGCTIWFYGLGVTQCLIMMLGAAVLSRAATDGGGTDGGAGQPAPGAGDEDGSRIRADLRRDRGQRRYRLRGHLVDRPRTGRSGDRHLLPPHLIVHDRDRSDRAGCGHRAGAR